MAMETVGIIAGGGQFPFLVARGARARGWRVVAAGFPGNTDPALEAEVDAYRLLKIGQLNKLIKYFSEQGVDRVVMAGTIAKARVMDMRPDFRAARLLASLATRGDDSLLRALARELESENLPVAMAHEVVPELVTPAGVLTRKKPSAEVVADAVFGWTAAKHVGSLDVGQTVVVKKQVVAAVEALEGTDRAIRRGLELAGKGAVVVKVAKPGQDQRVDLPSVGLGTIELLAELKGACLAVEAGRSLFFDREAALALANRAGVCVIGVDEAWAGAQAAGNASKG